jgi:hypothetical protein
MIKNLLIILTIVSIFAFQAIKSSIPAFNSIQQQLASIERY